MKWNDLLHFLLTSIDQQTTIRKGVQYQLSKVIAIKYPMECPKQFGFSSARHMEYE